MNSLENLVAVLSVKDDALLFALEHLQKFMEPCTEKTCDESYHWRGCPTVLKPILDQIRNAIKAR